MKLSEIIAAWENGEIIEYKFTAINPWNELPSYSELLDEEADSRIPFRLVSFINGTYRIKPRTLTINGIEFPEPIREPLRDGDIYWSVRIVFGTLISEHQWDNDVVDNWCLKNGLIQLTEEGARKQAEAMLSLLKPKE